MRLPNSANSYGELDSSSTAFACHLSHPLAPRVSNTFSPVSRKSSEPWARARDFVVEQERLRKELVQRIVKLRPPNMTYSISCTQVKIVKRIRLIGLDFDILRQVSLTLNWLSFETGQQIDRTSAASVKVFNIVQQCSKMSMLLRYARIACECCRILRCIGATSSTVSSVYDVSGISVGSGTRASLLLGTVVQPTRDPTVWHPSCAPHFDFKVEYCGCLKRLKRNGRTCPNTDRHMTPDLQ